MHHIDSLGKIILIFGFALVTFGCATNKTQSSNVNIGLKAEAVPEGIRLTFDYIPPETVQLLIDINEGTPEALYTSDNAAWAVSGVKDSALEQVKKTGKFIVPFVKAGRKNFITTPNPR